MDVAHALCALLVVRYCYANEAATRPVFASREALKAAVDDCLAEFSSGLCPNTQGGAPMGTWDVSAVTDMSDMFRDAAAFNQDLSAWDVSKVKDMSYMFYNAGSFNQNFSAWEVSDVTDMAYMFSYARAFNQDLSAWDTSSVIEMESMFMVAQGFNWDISAWDVSKVFNMRYMFSGANSFTQVLCSAAWLSSDADRAGMFVNSGANAAICTALPPSVTPATPPPSPPGVDPCENPCYGTTCLTFAAIPCSILKLMGCSSCTGCCSNSTATGVVCGTDDHWSEANSHCVLDCSGPD